MSFHPTVTGQIVARDQGKCARCGKHVAHLERGWAWSIHHRRPRSSGGTSLEWVDHSANGIILCGHGAAGCHGWVETHRAEARLAGFLISANGRLTAEDVALRHAVLGDVYLTDAGGWIPVEQGPTPESMGWAA